MKLTSFFKSKIIGLLIVSFVIIPNWLMSQPTGGGPGNGGDPDVPFEGLGFLIAAGIALGIKKLKNRK